MIENVGAKDDYIVKYSLKVDGTNCTEKDEMMGGLNPAIRKKRCRLIT